MRRERVITLLGCVRKFIASKLPRVPFLAGVRVTCIMLEGTECGVKKGGGCIIERLIHLIASQCPLRVVLPFCLLLYIVSAHHPSSAWVVTLWVI